MNTGLYVHIPFCATKCPYCDFYSGRYTKQKAEAYQKAIVADMASYKGQGIVADTLYFGGGTPSLLDPNLIGEMVSAAKESFLLPAESEITMEANPNTVSYEKLSALHAAGINRISFGVQSADEQILAALGRRHTAAQAAAAIENAYKAGITNISADIMLGVPYSSDKTVRHTIDFLAALPLSHISAYILKLEESTPFGKGLLPAPVPDDDTQAELYLLACDVLSEKGFLQYEISNFAKSKMESRHNLKYWLCEDYLGFGASAHSLFGGKRFCNPPDMDAYIKKTAAPEVTDSAPCSRAEQLMLALRLTRGATLTNTPFDREVSRRAAVFQKEGLLTINQNTIALTRKGMLLSNSILSALLF